jgi:predicted HNH restriction endonuclease
MIHNRGGFEDLLNFNDNDAVKEEDSEKESSSKRDSGFTLFTRQEVKKSSNQLDKIFNNDTDTNFSTNDYSDVIDINGCISTKYKNEFERNFTNKGK